MTPESEMLRIMAVHYRVGDRCKECGIEIRPDRDKGNTPSHTTNWNYWLGAKYRCDKVAKA